MDSTRVVEKASAQYGSVKTSIELVGRVSQFVGAVRDPPSPPYRSPLRREQTCAVAVPRSVMATLAGRFANRPYELVDACPLQRNPMNRDTHLAVIRQMWKSVCYEQIKRIRDIESFSQSAILDLWAWGSRVQ
jgi:hypothetical protein